MSFNKDREVVTVSLFFQVLQCDRLASDSDSGPTADSQSIAQGPGRDTTDSLSMFTFIS